MKLIYRLALLLALIVAFVYLVFFSNQAYSNNLNNSEAADRWPVAQLLFTGLDFIFDSCSQIKLIKTEEISQNNDLKNQLTPIEFKIPTWAEFNYRLKSALFKNWSPS